MRVLITGATGLLGKYLLETAPEGVELAITCHRLAAPAGWESRCFPLKLEDSAGVIRLLDRIRPDAILHTAGVGSVEEAERNTAWVRQVNVEGTQALARWCHQAGALLVAISSNAVFDGEDPPYEEASPREPVNRYGWIKVEAEDAVRASGCRHLVVRPILLYGWPWPGGRSNVVTRWLESFESASPVQVDQEITSMPLYAQDCAKSIWEALARDLTGTLHLAGPERLTLVEFALATARAFEYPTSLVQPVPSVALSGWARRPKDTSFLTHRLSRELGIQPLRVAEGLRQMKQTRRLAAGVPHSLPHRIP